MQEPNIDKRKQIRDIQTEIMILDADLKKKARSKEDILMEIKKMKREKDMMEMSIHAKEAELKKNDNEQIMLINEIKTLKKKMNLIS